MFRTDSNSYNSLWRQLTEVYGARGCPTKSAQTIINGSNENDIISKILRFLRYFVKYSKVVQNCLERINVVEDNRNADIICKSYQYSGNYLPQSSEQHFSDTQQIKSTLHKSKACLSNLSELLTNDHYEENYLLQEKKVTFLLGENEELINIKPHVKNTSKQTSIKNEPLEEITLSNPFIKHSSSCSALAALCAPPKQQYLEVIDIFNNKHSRSKSSDIKNENELDFEDKNEQVICMNSKRRNFHKITKMKILLFPLPK